MAVKKSELYSSLWASCDELRGGMDASLYKDYVLTLLFVKYVTDRFMGHKYAEIEVPKGGNFNDMIAAKGKSDIGERMNKIIKALANANPTLNGVIDIADFDDDTKLGSGKEKVDKLTNLVSIFQNESLDFRTNSAGGDVIIGEAFEYLMKNLACESGKSKGQFYTPAEVSRIMAKLIGINSATLASQTVYDPACGSGSLLIRAANEAPNGITIYGQEYDVNTTGLAKMNFVLHNYAIASVVNGNTLSSPKYKNGDRPEQFDFAVANPPFSYKSWSNGVDPGSDMRFTGYNAVPPNKNGDYAWLMHFIYSLKPGTGKGAIILPHGVLFRGNAEATIRTAIIKKKVIKGIIGLPPNLFFGTGIPACIIIIDKENAAARKGLFIIDASRGFVKDGNKNRLREQDIRKIVDCFTNFKDIPKYSRMIPYSEIEGNDYNLNIPRYIDSSEPEDLQDIEAHLSGGLPQHDIDELSSYWGAFPSMKEELFTDFGRDGYVKLKIKEDDIRDSIYGNDEFMELLNWIKKCDDPKYFIEELSNDLLQCFSNIDLIDKYDVYQSLMSHWEETMQDDVYAIASDGWGAGNEIERQMAKKKDGTPTAKMKSFDGRLIPKQLIVAAFFADKQEEINRLQNKSDELTNQMEELKEEHSGEDGLLNEVINDKGNITKGDLQKRIKEISKDKDLADELVILKQYDKLVKDEAAVSKSIKEKLGALDRLVIKKYGELSIKQIKELVVDKKWCATVYASIEEINTALVHRLTNRITELVERYEQTLPEIENEIADYESKVKVHLERMGFSWK